MLIKCVVFGQVISSNTPDCLPPLDNIKNDEPIIITNRREENEKESTGPSNESHKVCNLKF